MRGTYAELHVHLVWATWDRLPLITAETEPLLYRAIVDAGERIHVEVRAIGGVEDHVHVLARVPPTVPVATLAHQLKGSSSHLVSARGDSFLKWQGAYGGFSISRWDLRRVERYIRRQKEHHRDGTLSRHLETVG